MAALEFWYEFASTYSYPAAMRIEMLAAGEGVGLRWRPFLLGPLFKEHGWNDSPFNMQRRGAVCGAISPASARAKGSPSSCRRCASRRTG